MQDFIETLKSFGMNPRSMSGGNHFAIFKFNKWGGMTDSTYLKSIKESIIEDEIQNIDDVLIELRDDGWVVNTFYIPFRYIPNTYHHINDTDYINIVIKKNQNESNSKYPPGSDFKFTEIEDYVYRILDMYSDKKITLQVIKHDSYFDSSKQPGFKTGVYIDLPKEDLNNLISDSILGFVVKVQLDGKNLDNFKKPVMESINKDLDIIEDIKMILSEFEDYELNFTVNNDQKHLIIISVNNEIYYSEIDEYDNEIYDRVKNTNGQINSENIHIIEQCVNYLKSKLKPLGKNILDDLDVHFSSGDKWLVYSYPRFIHYIKSGRSVKKIKFSFIK
jgi:hypothetical protein